MTGERDSAAILAQFDVVRSRASSRRCASLL